MSKSSDPIVKAVQKFTQGKTMQEEAMMRLRQLLPEISEAGLVKVAASITTLVGGAPAATGPTVTVKEIPATVTGITEAPAKKKTRKAKKGKPYNQDTALECLRTTMKDRQFTARELADELGMGSAQGLAPVLNMLKDNKAVKRHKLKDGIYWTIIPQGLKAFIKAATKAA